MLPGFTIVTGAPASCSSRASRSEATLLSLYGPRPGPSGLRSSRTTPPGRVRATVEETCTSVRHPASRPAWSTARVPAVLSRSIRSRSRRRKEYVAAACTTASHPSTATRTAEASVMSPRATSIRSSSVDSPSGLSPSSRRAGVRTKARTRWPASSRWWTVCTPRNPEAPVSRTVVMPPHCGRPAEVGQPRRTGNRPDPVRLGEHHHVLRGAGCQRRDHLVHRPGGDPVVGPRPGLDPGPGTAGDGVGDLGIGRADQQHEPRHRRHGIGRP